MIKLLIGGSPCTFWSIAQKNGRETEAKGIGWELFKNYLIAKEKFKPDFFLYENNKSAAQPIKNQIAQKDASVVGQMGTTPRRLTDLIGSLCDLTSGSGDKGTPIIWIQGYFDNYTSEY